MEFKSVNLMSLCFSDGYKKLKIRTENCWQQWPDVKRHYIRTA